MQADRGGEGGGDLRAEKPYQPIPCATGIQGWDWMDWKCYQERANWLSLSQDVAQGNTVPVYTRHNLYLPPNFVDSET